MILALEVLAYQNAKYGLSSTDVGVGSNVTTAIVYSRLMCHVSRGTGIIEHAVKVET